MERNLPLIKLLSKSTAAERRKILKSAPKELITALTEGSLNLIRGTVPLSKQKISKLRRYKKQLKTVAAKKVSAQKKKKILQRGGFLPLLASVLVPAISGLISGLVSQ